MLLQPEVMVDPYVCKEIVRFDSLSCFYHLAVLTYSLGIVYQLIYDKPYIGYLGFTGNRLTLVGIVALGTVSSCTYSTTG